MIISYNTSSYVASTSTNNTEPIGFQEAVQHFESIDLNEYADKIKPTLKQTGFASLIHSIVGPAKLHKSLVSQRNLIFTLALVPFNNEDKEHIRILQTLFKTLTRRKLDCSRFGDHWELIGFQGIYFSLCDNIFRSMPITLLSKIDNAMMASQ